MKNIKIRFLGVGYNEYCQPFVCVYDECNNLIYEGCAYNACISIDACVGSLYRVVAKTNNSRIFGAFYVNCRENLYTLAFPNAFYEAEEEEEEIVTFRLTDYYYESLPIERGEILLWQE